MEKNGLYSLNEILEIYDSVLLDTCTLIAPFAQQRTNDPLKNISRMYFNHRLRKNILCALENHDPLFITEGISLEYRAGAHFNYKKNIKFLDNLINKEDLDVNRKEELDCLRFQRNAKSERLHFLREFKEKDMVLNLSKGQEAKYSKLKDKHYSIMKNNGLRDNNIILILSAAVLANTVGSSAVLSNNRNIKKARNHLVKEGEVDGDDFSVYVREIRNQFKVWN